MMESPYHLILITLGTTAAYLFTLLLVNTGILVKTLHRRLWNSVLLLTFLVSGLLGLLLVIRVNYRLEWSFLNPLMTWHVDTGIAMTLVAMFHFLWHSSYYLNFFRHGKNIETMTAGPPPGTKIKNRHTSTQDHHMVPFILGAGFFSTVVQVLLIREITTLFQGNELMMGWTLAIWMFLTGAGTWGGRSRQPPRPLKAILPLFLLLAWLPPLLLLLMNLTRHLLFSPGQLISPFWFLLMILLLLAPLCLLSGYLYSMMVHLTGSRGTSFVKVYAFESAGSLAGGILVTFLLIRWFPITQSLLLTSLALHLLILWRFRQRMPLFSFGLLILATLLAFLWPVDMKIKSWLFPGQQVVENRETPWGNITVTANGGEFNFFENGNLLFSTGDMVLNEEYVHYAMLQHRSPKEVLLVSGGMAGMTSEILKYPSVAAVDVVELNPAVVRMARDYQRENNDPRIHGAEGDGRRFIHKTSRRYDVAVMAVPDPSSLQINRYYTDGFIKLLKEKLNDGAVVLFGLSPTGNYITPEKARIGATLYHTLKKHFKQVLILPGERDYYLASDGELSPRIGELAAKGGVKGSYVNSDYMDDASLEARGSEIRRAAEALTLLNTDNKPLPVFYHSLQFITLYAGNHPWIMALPLLLLLVPLFLLNPVSAGMYVTGFTASAAEIMLIFWFQIVFGNLYSALGLIFALFMGGLALGSVAARRMDPSGAHLLPAQLLLAGVILLFPLLWRLSGLPLSGAAAWLVFLPFLLGPALLTGFLYVSATLRCGTQAPHAASVVYAADLWGSALGAILTTFILLPVAGVTHSALTIAALNGAVILLLILRKKR